MSFARWRFTMKRWLRMGLVLCVSPLLGVSLWLAWQQNQTAVTAITHLSRTSSCAVDEVRLQWNGDEPIGSYSPYLQAVMAATSGTEIGSPGFNEWNRDARLYYWFLAQTAVKNKAYDKSLLYLATARAGAMLDAAGHTTIATGHTECTLINWTVASELGYREPPDGYVQHMMNTEQEPQVVEAFSRLLQYDAQRADWRLSLAKAYLAVGETAVAEETLAPVLLNGTPEQVEAANTLLQSGS